MPNHVSHKMIFDIEKCADLIMRMKMFETHDYKTDGPLDFNMFCPVDRKHSGVDDAVNAHGTKWNAYQQNYNSFDKGILYFDTAWSTAEPVWYAIAEQFPNAEIVIYYSDEDLGRNLGIVTISNGTVDWREESHGSDKNKCLILNQTNNTDNFHICEKVGEICSDTYTEGKDSHCQGCLEYFETEG